MTAFDIALWCLAIVGACTVLLLVIAAFAVVFGKDDTAHHPIMSHREERQYERTMELQREINRTFIEDRDSPSGFAPTINGRLTAIEKHLGLQVYVKPSVSPRVAVRVNKTKED